MTAVIQSLIAVRCSEVLLNCLQDIYGSVHTYVNVLAFCFSPRISLLLIPFPCLYVVQILWNTNSIFRTILQEQPLIKSQARSQDYQKGGYLHNIIAHEVYACVRKHARLGGSGGMPPRKFLKFRCSETTSQAILRQSTKKLQRVGKV